MVTIYVLVIIVTLHLCQSAENVIDVFDSADSQRPNLRLQELTIHNSDEVLLSITVMIFDENYYYADYTPISAKGRWFLDGMPVPTWSPASQKSSAYTQLTTKSYGISSVRKFLLKSSKLQLESLVNRNLTLVIGRFLETGFDPLPQDIDIVWLQLDIPGKELGPYLESKNLVLKFDHLTYKIREHGNLPSKWIYSAAFSFPEMSVSTVDSVEVTFEGNEPDSNSPEYRLATSKCGQDEVCEDSYAAEVAMIEENENKRKSILISLSNDVVNNYQGIFTIKAKTTNIMNTKITETYDITSSAYNGSEYFSDTHVWITNMEFKSSGNVGIIKCRGMGKAGFGDELDIRMRVNYRSRFTSMTPKEVIRSRYIATAYFVFPLTGESSGRYVCKMKHWGSTIQRKTINLTCRSEATAEITGTPICFVG